MPRHRAAPGAFVLALLGATGLLLALAVSGNSASSSVTAKVYVMPASVSGTAGATVTAEIRMSVVGDTVNAVAANLTYPAANLTYVDATVAPAWSVTAAKTGGGGAIDVEVGTSTPLSGDQLVATVTFTKQDAGSVPISVSPTSQLISATTNTDLLHQSTTSGGGGGTTAGQSTTIGSTPTSTTTTQTTTQTATTQTATPSTTTTAPPKPRRVLLVLPRRSLTPGVTNPAVKQTTIRETICVAKWTTKIRPPASYTNALKLKQMKQYGEKGSRSAYEEDHLIPLELGGAPRNPKNLWPEPRAESKHSDPLETALKRKVCARTLTLAAARKQILAYKRTNG